MLLLNNNQDVLHGMHKVMFPVMGWLFFMLFVAVCVAVAKLFSTIEKGIPFVLYFLAGTQFIMAMFLVISPHAYFAFQLMGTSAFVLYAVITDNPHHLKLASIFTLFNLFCAMGKVAFLGYIQSLTETSVAGDAYQQECIAWFGLSGNNVDKNSLCDGWVSYLRFVGFSIYLWQFLQAFLLYVWYKEAGDGSSASSGSSSGSSGKEYAPVVASATAPPRAGAYGSLVDEAPADA